MRVFAVSACALALVGCRTGGSRAVTLRYWNGFTGPDGRTMLRLVKQFNRENPDVYVLMQRMDWATYYNKLFVAGLGRRAPEVFVLQTHAVPRFARARFVRPLDDLISAAAGPWRQVWPDVDPNIRQGVEYGGRNYGLPLDIWPMGMYYNAALFRQAGIVDSQGRPGPPEGLTRVGFVEMLRRLTRPAAAGQPAQWGFVFTNLESNVYSVMAQYGGPFFTPGMRRCTLDDPRNVAALQFCCDLIRKYRVAAPPEDVDAWVGFRQGKVATAFEGIYMLADLQQEKDEQFGGAPIPLLGAQRGTWAGSHNLCVRADLRGPRLAAAARFIRFLSDHSLDWAAGGQVPARRSLRDTPRFRAMPVQSAFAREVPYARYMPRVTFAFEFQTEFDKAVERALRGTVTPRQALADATARVNAVIARDRAVNGGEVAEMQNAKCKMQIANWPGGVAR